MYNYKQQSKTKGSINNNETIIGDTLEVKIEKIMTKNEPIDAKAEIIFTERKDGVMHGYNIRTDRFEVALEAMDKVNRSKIAGRESKSLELNKKTDVTEPIQDDKTSA